MLYTKVLTLVVDVGQIISITFAKLGVQKRNQIGCPWDGLLEKIFIVLFTFYDGASCNGNLGSKEMFDRWVDFFVFDCWRKRIAITKRTEPEEEILSVQNTMFSFIGKVVNKAFPKEGFFCCLACFLVLCVLSQ